MITSQRCGRCGLDNPADARFCIGCSTSLVPAATGATTKLAGQPCPACRTVNPQDAQFCVGCGRSFEATRSPRQHPASHRQAPRVPAPPVSYQPRHSFPRVAPPMPAMRMSRQHTARRPHTGVLFMLGLAVLLMTGLIWPGILLLIGAVKYVEASETGRARQGMKMLVWFAGLTILFATHTFWPGILLLFVLSWLLD